MSASLTKTQQAVVDGYRTVLRSSTGANGVSLAGLAKSLGMTEAATKTFVLSDSELHEFNGKVFAGAFPALPNAAAVFDVQNRRAGVVIVTATGGTAKFQERRERSDTASAITNARKNALLARDRAQQKGAK